LIAFDTNILVYAQQEDDLGSRHKRAAGLIEIASLYGAIVPVQVLGEFLNVCMRKFKMAPVDAIEQVQDYVEVFLCPHTTTENLNEAANLSKYHKLQYFDALIIAVASRAGATILLSEDMQDGSEVDGIKIVNPFSAENETLLSDYFGNAS
jgi:predicted nucleic acid-binding protein